MTTENKGLAASNELQGPGVIHPPGFEQKIHILAEIFSDTEQERYSQFTSVLHRLWVNNYKTCLGKINFSKSGTECSVGIPISTVDSVSLLSSLGFTSEDKAWLEVQVEEGRVTNRYCLTFPGISHVNQGGPLSVDIDREQLEGAAALLKAVKERDATSITVTTSVAFGSPTGPGGIVSDNTPRDIEHFNTEAGLALGFLQTTGQVFKDNYNTQLKENVILQVNAESRGTHVAVPFMHMVKSLREGQKLLTLVHPVGWGGRQSGLVEKADRVGSALVSYVESRENVSKRFLNDLAQSGISLTTSAAKIAYQVFSTLKFLDHKKFSNPADTTTIIQLGVDDVLTHMFFSEELARFIDNLGKIPLDLFNGLVSNPKKLAIALSAGLIGLFTGVDEALLIAFGLGFIGNTIRTARGTRTRRMDSPDEVARINARKAFEGVSLIEYHTGGHISQPAKEKVMQEAELLRNIVSLLETA